MFSILYEKMEEINLERRQSPECMARELYGMTKGIDEMIDESVLRQFGNIERMRNNRIAKRVYVGESIKSHLVGCQWKRWINSVNDRLKKKKVQKLGKQGEQCMIKMNERGCEGRGMLGAQPGG